MAADGYGKGGGKMAPDAKWWIEEISRGAEFRKKHAYQDRWRKWYDYYRCNFNPKIMPVNVFFSMLRATVPRVYFRNPAVSVTPGQPGFVNMAFAQCVNRLDNTLISDMRIKQHMKLVVQDTFLKGTGFLKTGLGSVKHPDIGESPIEDRERFEYSEHIRSNHPWARRTCASNVVVPCGTPVGSLEDVRWVAVSTLMAKDDLKRDPRFKNIKDYGEYLPTYHVSEDYTQGMTQIWEVYDMKYNVFLLLAPTNQPGKGEVVDWGESDICAVRKPLYELIFNPDGEHFWGIPDAKQLEPHQLEINETNTQIMKHRRLSILKGLIKKGLMDDIEMEKLTSEDVMAFAQMDGNVNTDVKVMQVGGIPQEIIQAKTLIMQDIRDTVGFSRNQLGEFQSRRGDTSATEAAIVQQGSEIRVDERRDAVADMMQEVIVEQNRLIMSTWSDEDVFEVVGPGGVQVWVKVRPTLLSQGKYKLKVDPDSGAYKTRREREQRAMEVYGILKTNPIIDPFKLTQYLLTELEGVEFDDLMRVIPPVPGFDPGNVLNPGGLASLMQAGFQGMAQNGPQQIPSSTGGGGE